MLVRHIRQNSDGKSHEIHPMLCKTMGSSFQHKCISVTQCLGRYFWTSQPRIRHMKAGVMELLHDCVNGQSASSGPMSREFENSVLVGLPSVPVLR